MTNLEHRYFLIDLDDEDSSRFGTYVGEFWSDKDVVMIDGIVKVIATGKNPGYYCEECGWDDHEHNPPHLP